MSDTIESLIPDDKDYKRCMDVAQSLPAEEHNRLIERVHAVLKDTHAYESDYLAAVGNLKEKEGVKK
jgi:hypothetical protein